MKKIKKQNGITLIALIVTIVILIILASVAISGIDGDGIIKQANEAHNQAENFISNTQKQHQEYVDYLKGELGGLGTSCEHSDISYSYTDTGITQHKVIITCKKCFQSTTTVENHKYKLEYSPESGEVHYVTEYCELCGYYLRVNSDAPCDGDGCVCRI